MATVTQRAACSHGRANQPRDVHGSSSGPKLHGDVEQCLRSIGDEEVLCALRIADIEDICTPVKLETLSTTDGEGGKGQNERPSVGVVHKMEEESEVDGVVRVTFRARCLSQVLCL